VAAQHARAAASSVFRWKLTAHEVVDDGIDGAVEIAQPMRDQGELRTEVILDVDLCVSVGKQTATRHTCRSMEFICD
jgi:hypothetical protein